MGGRVCLPTPPPLPVRSPPGGAGACSTNQACTQASPPAAPPPSIQTLQPRPQRSSGTHLMSSVSSSNSRAAVLPARAGAPLALAVFTSASAARAITPARGWQGWAGAGAGVSAAGLQACGSHRHEAPTVASRPPVATQPPHCDCTANRRGARTLAAALWTPGRAAAAAVCARAACIALQADGHGQWGGLAEEGRAQGHSHAPISHRHPARLSWRAPTKCRPARIWAPLYMQTHLAALHSQPDSSRSSGRERSAGQPRLLGSGAAVSGSLRAPSRPHVAPAVALIAQRRSGGMAAAPGAAWRLPSAPR